MAAKVIDAHHHLWRYSAAEYPWISDAMAPLRRDFLPEDLLLETRSAGVDGVVSVQARQSVEETNWLLELAERSDLIRGVVGWVPLASRDCREELERLAGSLKLKAVRHVLQDEPDDFMLSDAFNAGLAVLPERGLVYDLLILARQLPAAIELVDRHPDQVFVLDHLAKPEVAAGKLTPWRQNLRELARRPGVFCKLSGLTTEADWKHWTPEQLRPYVDVALEAFGAERLMFGSDWPVCLAATSYVRWLDVVREAVAPLSKGEQAMVLGGTACSTYRL